MTHILEISIGLLVGWLIVAKVLDNLPVPGRPAGLDYSRVGWLVVLGLTAL